MQIPNVPDHSFAAVTEAVSCAIKLNDYRGIDPIIENDLNALTQLENGKTPIFHAVEAVIGKHLTPLNGMHQPIVREQIILGLKHIFHQIDIRLKFDTNISIPFIRDACNGAFRTRLLNGHKGTLRDLLEAYASVHPIINSRRGSYQESHPDLHYLVDTYQLKHGKIPTPERTRNMKQYDVRGTFL